MPRVLGVLGLMADCMVDYGGQSRRVVHGRPAISYR